jgi:hypothetical protein
MLQLRAARPTWCPSLADVIHESMLKLHHAFLPLTSARAMVHAVVDLWQKFKCVDGNRNALEDCPQLMAVSNIPEMDFGFDMVPDFHTQDQDAKWVPELVRLVRKFGGGQGSKPNSPKANYLTLQINRMPCGCRYDYTGTNGKLLVWGADSSSPIIQEMMQHFIERMDLQDDHDVPGCLVINVYEEESHYIEWHSDESDRWGAIDMDANIFTWNLGAHGFFQLTVRARSELAKFLVGKGGKEHSINAKGHRGGWVVPPQSMSVMSKRCQSSCVHRVVKPSEAQTMEAVRDWPGYTHQSVQKPRVVVSLRTMRQHDADCAQNKTVPRWLVGISPPNSGPCASTDAAATPSTQDQSDVNATSQTHVTVVDSALPGGPPVPDEGPDWDRWPSPSEDEQMQVSEKKPAEDQPVPPTKTPSKPRWPSEDEQMQVSEKKPAEDQPVPQTKTPSKRTGHRGNIERTDHTEVTEIFEKHLQKRVQEIRYFEDKVDMGHETVLRGYTRGAKLYRVMMPLRQFRSLVADAMCNYKEALLRQGKWCFTMTRDVRDNLFWIDLAGEADPTFKKFDWTQINLPRGSFCSIDKFELSMEYHKTCIRITHREASLRKSTSERTARSRSPQKKATGKASSDATRADTESQRLSNVREWSSLITDLKIGEMMQTAHGFLERPPLPPEWPIDRYLEIDTWPLICWTVGGVLVRR